MVTAHTGAPVVKLCSRNHLLPFRSVFLAKETVFGKFIIALGNTVLEMKATALYSTVLYLYFSSKFVGVFESF